MDLDSTAATAIAAAAALALALAANRLCDYYGRRWPGRPLPGRAVGLGVAAAILFGLSASRHGLTARFCWDAVFATYLLLVAVIDGERQVIPNELNAAGIGVGLVMLGTLEPIPWQPALGGALLTGGFFHLSAVFARGGIGGGDLKFSPGLGLFLGLPNAVAGLTLGLLFGAAAALYRLILRPPGWREPFAYGPALAAGGLVAIAIGDELLSRGLAAWLPLA